MIYFSWFNNFFDSVPKRCTAPSWEDFVRIMFELSEVTRYKPKADEFIDDAAPLISSAYYPKDGDPDDESTHRSNENMLGWPSFILLDIDDGAKSLEEVREKFKPLTTLMYSSPSNTKEKLKMRVIIKLDSPVPKKHCVQVWHALSQWTDGWVDKQTKDQSRIQYVCGRYTNKGDDYVHFIEHNYGVDLNWKNLITMYPSSPEVERFKKENAMKSLKQAIYKNNHDMPSFDITDPNCPFVYRSMIDDYMLTPSGGHHAAIYKFMIRICYRAEKIGYPLSIEDLVDMAQQLDAIDGGWYDEKKLRNSARDAIEYTGV